MRRFVEDVMAVSCARLVAARGNTLETGEERKEPEKYGGDGLVGRQEAKGATRMVEGGKGKKKTKKEKDVQKRQGQAGSVNDIPEQRLDDFSTRVQVVALEVGRKSEYLAAT